MIAFLDFFGHPTNIDCCSSFEQVYAARKWLEEIRSTREFQRVQAKYHGNWKHVERIDSALECIDNRISEFSEELHNWHDQTALQQHLVSALPQ